MAKFDFSSPPPYIWRIFLGLLFPLSLFSLSSLFFWRETTKQPLTTNNVTYTESPNVGQPEKKIYEEKLTPLIETDPLPKSWCTDEIRISQRNKFLAARKTVGKRELGCGQLKDLESFLTTLWDPSKEEVNLVNIGANKGYNLVDWLENWRLSPPSVSVSSWGRHLIGRFPKLPKWALCGTCNECGPAPLNLEEQEVHKGPGKGVHLYALEPSITNYKLLLDMKKWSRYGKITLLNAAASNESGVLQFPVTKVGFTMGKLTKSQSDKTIDVRVFTVEEFMEEHKIERINYLQVDTEGHDPLVIFSARKALEEHKIDLLEFEYHYFGHWKKTKLRNVVELFDSQEYDCFLELWKDSSTWDHLVCLTGCWEDTFEFHNWSNVLCSSRRNVKLTTHLRSMCKWI